MATLDTEARTTKVQLVFISEIWQATQFLPP